MVHARHLDIEATGVTRLLHVEATGVYPPLSIWPIVAALYLMRRRRHLGRQSGIPKTIYRGRFGNSINYEFMVIRGRILIREIGKKIAYTQQAHSPKFLIQYL